MRYVFIIAIYTLIKIYKRIIQITFTLKFVFDMSRVKWVNILLLMSYTYELTRYLYMCKDVLKFIYIFTLYTLVSLSFF